MVPVLEQDQKFCLAVKSSPCQTADIWWSFLYFATYIFSCFCYKIARSQHDWYSPHKINDNSDLVGKKKEQGLRFPGAALTCHLLSCSCLCMSRLNWKPHKQDWKVLETKKFLVYIWQCVNVISRVPKFFNSHINFPKVSWLPVLQVWNLLLLIVTLLISLLPYLRIVSSTASCFLSSQVTFQFQWEVKISTDVALRPVVPLCPVNALYSLK